MFLGGLGGAALVGLSEQTASAAEAIKIGGRGQWRVEADQLEAYIKRMYAETRDYVDQHPFVESDAEGSELASDDR